MRIGRLVLVFGLMFAAPAHGADLTLTLSGTPSVVFNSTRDGCEPNDIPDLNPRAYRDSNGGVTLFGLHFFNRALRGPDFAHLKIDCHVALGSPLDADPAHHADRNFIAATWTPDGRSVSALVHEEYHADDHGRCRVSGELGCWYNSVLAYQSHDGGANFDEASPLVVASAPFTQDVEQGRHRGFFNPSNIVADGPYRYAFVSTTGWDSQPFGNCLFRTDDPSKPASWRAYDGTAFTIRYADPYKAKSKPKPCKAIAPFAYAVGGVVHHRPSNLWIAVFQAPSGGVFPVDGFYYAVGRDLLHWGAPRLLVAGKTLYGDLCKAGPSIINYPSLLDPTSSSRNFDEIGATPELFFTIMQVAGCQTGERLLVRQPLTLLMVESKP
ncbi:hypothetical protein [Beijerinckia sp. L45]|uniref:hypothetical protein n=1 Tax=Beijerinckia sp. L45 TaxID=1641855 RepID=UPI00131BC609|nr:hypothetical protein [Beijerinckia sp. L45]